MAALLEQLSGNLDRMHQVGQNAMDEIYISWDQAVRIAYDRYKEIHEMAKSGELGIRKHQSFEYLMNSAADILNGTQKVFVDIPREIHEGMRENYEEFKGKVSDNLQEMKGNMEDFKEDFRENVENFKSDINDSFDRLKDNITGDFSDDKYDDT